MTEDKAVKLSSGVAGLLSESILKETDACNLTLRWLEVDGESLGKVRAWIFQFLCKK
jgi:hypothetical protein